MTGRLIHLNGAPGVGKSTLARAWVAARPGALNCDIDLLRQLIGGWDDDHATTGVLVRPLALAMISAHVARGRQVVLPQLLADPVELERFVSAATGVGGTYTGILLDLPDEELGHRWRDRDTAEPTTASSNRVIVADGGDDAVLEWARRLREEYAARCDVTVVEMDGLDVAGSLVELEDLLSRGPGGSA